MRGRKWEVCGEGVCEMWLQNWAASQHSHLTIHQSYPCWTSQHIMLASLRTLSRRVMVPVAPARVRFLKKGIGSRDQTSQFIRPVLLSQKSIFRPLCYTTASITLEPILNHSISLQDTHVRGDNELFPLIALGISNSNP